MPEPPGITAGYARLARIGWRVFWGAWLVIGLALVLAGAIRGSAGLAVPGAGLALASAPMLWLTLRRLSDPRPVLVIGPGFYHDRRLGLPIPWAEMRGLRRRKTGNRLFLQIEVDDPARFMTATGILRKPMLALNPRMGFSVLASNLAGLDQPQERLAAAAERHWSAAHGPGF